MNVELQSEKYIAVVMLNYNSERDLMTSAPQLAAQNGVKHTLVLVDNASRAESVATIRAWLANWRPDAVIGTQAEVNAWVDRNPEQARTQGRVYFILSNENRGYSAGNNLGIRLADTLGTDAILIANPDMRIEDSNYLYLLTTQLFADESNYIAASRIIGLDGKDQNPLREASFWEELLWPRIYLAKLFGAGSYGLTTAMEKPATVPKVSGCCLMLRMSFLRATAYLDENVFLYCEEPILSARVHSHGGRIFYVPSISAVHAHVRSEKGNTGKRMLLFIKSRKYYLEKYSSYKEWQLQLLKLSYGALALLSAARSRVSRHKS